MKVRGWASVAVLALAALALAHAVSACGGAGNGAGASDPPKAADRREGALEFAQCMRERGIEMPDPEPGGGGLRIKVGSGGPDGQDPKFRAAEKECQKHLRPPSGVGRESSPQRS